MIRKSYPQKKIKVPIKQLIAERALIWVAIAFLITIPTILFYQNFRSIVIQQAADEATNVAIAVATFIEDDINDYRKLVQVTDYAAGSYDKAYYDRMLGIFRTIRSNTKVSYLFTEKWISNDQTAYILDGEDPASEFFSPIGSLDEMNETERQAFLENKAASTGLVLDPQWGSYVTGFAPIMDRTTNESLGLVGVDYSVDYISNLLSRLRVLLLVIQAIIVFVAAHLANQMFEQRNLTVNTDYVTNLYSKKYFEQSLKSHMAMAKSNRENLSLIMIDIDAFKSINDSYGHVAGDIVLREAANIVQSNTRNYDIACRYGGDEISVILPNASFLQAKRVADRILEDTSVHEILLESGQTIRLSMSLGIAEYKSGMSPKDLISEADEAMYAMKHAKNRNQISF